MYKLVVCIEIKINNSCSTWFHSCESLTSKLHWIKNNYAVVYEKCGERVTA
jgi:hypothetical protein